MPHEGIFDYAPRRTLSSKERKALCDLVTQAIAKMRRSTPTEKPQP